MILLKNLLERLLENFRKSYEPLFDAHIGENQTNKITKNFQKIYCEFSVDLRQTVGDSYFNKYLTIPVPRLCQVCL